MTLLTNGGGIFIQANLVCAPSCVQKISHVISVPIFSASKTTSSSSLGCRGSCFLVFFEEVACLECSVALARWTRWRRRCSPRRGKSRALSPGTGRSSEKHWMGGTFGTIPKSAVLCKRKKRSGVASVASESEDAVKDFQLIVGHALFSIFFGLL